MDAELGNGDQPDGIGSSHADSGTRSLRCAIVASARPGFRSAYRMREITPVPTPRMRASSACEPLESAAAHRRGNAADVLGPSQFLRRDVSTMTLGILSTVSTVNCKPDAGRGVALPFVSMATADDYDLTTLAGRLRYAIDEAGTTPTATERATMSRGYMSRVLSGQREALNPETLQKLQDFLSVSYEWLATGRGAMRAGVELSPREEGAMIARRLGALPSAVDLVLSRDAEVERDLRGWVDACLVESDAQRRAGVAEAIVSKKQKAIREYSARKREAPLQLHEPTPKRHKAAG